MKKIKGEIGILLKLRKVSIVCERWKRELELRPRHFFQTWAFFQFVLMVFHIQNNIKTSFHHFQLYTFKIESGIYIAGMYSVWGSLSLYWWWSWLTDWLFPLNFHVKWYGVAFPYKKILCFSFPYILMLFLPNLLPKTCFYFYKYIFWITLFSYPDNLV